MAFFFICTHILLFKLSLHTICVNVVVFLLQEYDFIQICQCIYFMEFPFKIATMHVCVPLSGLDILKTCNNNDDCDPNTMVCSDKDGGSKCRKYILPLELSQATFVRKNKHIASQSV
jgi:hypothetical protein